MSAVATGIPFARGFDSRRNPAGGAPSMARCITLALNELNRTREVRGVEKPVYDVAELEKVAANPKSPHHKAAAARLILSAREAGYDKLERVPKCLAALREILDRLIGKPVMSIDVNVQTAAPPPAEVYAAAVSAFRRDRVAAAMMRRALDEAASLASLPAVQPLRDEGEYFANNIGAHNARHRAAPAAPDDDTPT